MKLYYEVVKTPYMGAERILGGLTMARYIDADKLLEYLEKEAESEDVKYSFIGAGVQATINEIKKFPLEDAKPVIHAHWLTSMEKFEKNWFAMDRCSNCSWLKPILVEGAEISFNYCPNCGAKIDEEVD